MIGLTAHSSTGSGRTVKPYTVPRLQWVAVNTKHFVQIAGLLLERYLLEK